MKHTARLSVLAAMAMVLNAQVSEQIRRATLQGTGGTSGKCTIEVRVDMVAEVDILGDSGRLRTIAGQPATWTRMECTGPLPYNMTDFQFRGVDGRGSQQLVQDPRNNNSIAVVRIEDRRGGAEGYTFDIEWSGASGGAATDGFTTPSAIPGSDQRYGTERRGRYGRARTSSLTSEQMIDLCRTEVRARGERDYGLRNIDITAAAVDTDQNRRNVVTGSFNDRTAGFRRGRGYRFNCQVDMATGQVQTVDFTRADGSAMQTTSGTQSTTYGTQSTTYPTTYGTTADQTSMMRACQDAVVARANRDGYEGVRFGSTTADASRTGAITGSITASRASITDTFDFTCSMDTRTATVRNLDWRRR